MVTDVAAATLLLRVMETKRKLFWAGAEGGVLEYPGAEGGGVGVPGSCVMAG
jgi:hypothetical protein